MERQFNFIYTKLVQADEDLVGLIAYGIYKKHKIEFIEKIKADTGHAPTEDECQTFYFTCTTDSQLEHYRMQAEAMLSETISSIAREELTNYERDMYKNFKSEIKSCIPSNWSSLGFSVLAGLLSTLLFSIIASLFYFIGETSDKSTHEKVKSAIEEVQESPQDSIQVKNK